MCVWTVCRETAEKQRQERVDRRLRAPKVRYDPLAEHVMRAAIEYCNAPVPDDGMSAHFDPVCFAMLLWHVPVVPLVIACRDSLGIPAHVFNFM